MNKQQMQEQFNEIVKRVDQLESSLNSVKRHLRKFEEDHLKVDYTQIDGKVGKFDGTDMVTDAGEHFKIPPNYAAKSKLVFGDVLKMIEEGGRNLFKQIERVEREKVEGILTKKEGEWYMLTDRGSYKVSDAAAEFQKAELNAEVTAYLPADNLDAPFATIDLVAGFGEKKEEDKKPSKKPKKSPKKEAKKETKKENKEEKRKEDKKEEKKPAAEKKSSAKSKRRSSKKSAKKEAKNKDEKKKSSGKKKILADDDLV